MFWILNNVERHILVNTKNAFSSDDKPENVQDISTENYVRRMCDSVLEHN
jgi:hypothetical protein